MYRVAKGLLTAIAIAASTSAPAVRYTVTYNGMVESFQTFADSPFGPAFTTVPAADLNAIVTFDDLSKPSIVSFGAENGVFLVRLPTSFAITLGQRHYDLAPASQFHDLDVFQNRMDLTAYGQAGDLGVYLHFIEGPRLDGFSGYDTTSISFIPQPGDLDAVSFDLSLPTDYLGSTRVTTVSVTVAASPTANVPEPSSWATMLMGFGLIGAAIRRSRLRPFDFCQGDAILRTAPPTLVSRARA